MIFGIDQWTVDRLTRMLRWFEARPADGGEEEPRVPNWQHVRITGEAVEDQDLNYYPGIIETWDATEEEPIEFAEVWVHEANDAPLKDDSVYSAQQSGSIDLGDEITPDSRTLMVVALGGGETITFVKCVSWLNTD